MNRSAKVRSSFWRRLLTTVIPANPGPSEAEAVGIQRRSSLMPSRPHTLGWGTMLVSAIVLALPSGASAQAPVAARDLPRGAVLTAEDVVVSDADTLAGGTDRIGWVTRRVINEGEILREPAVARPQLVKSGDTVDLIWSTGTVQIKARGQATGSGAMGDRVTVRLDTRRRLEGVVVAPGVVRLNSSDKGTT